jgi:hypothetical protein
MVRRWRPAGRRIVLALVALIMARAGAEADPIGTVSLTYLDSASEAIDLTDNLTVNMPANATAGINAYAYSGNVYVGFYQYQVNSGPTVNSFCMDAFNESSSSAQPYSVISLASGPVASAYGNVAMGPAAAQTIEALWAMNYNNALASSTVAAELQEAIWMTEVQAIGGTFSSSTYETAATAMVTATGSYAGSLPDLFAYSNPTMQDFIGVPDAGATAMLLGLSLPVLVLIRRKCF